MRITKYTLQSTKRGFICNSKFVICNLAGSARERGMTMLELLIVMAIFVALAAFITILSGDLMGLNLRFNRSLLVEQEIQQTLTLIVPELRSAAQSHTGSYPIEQASTSTLIFYSDIDGDTKIERVRYFLQSGVFKKGLVEPTGQPLGYTTSSEVIVDLVANMTTSTIFTYYDATATSSQSTPLSDPVNVLDIKMINVSLIANQGTTSTPSLVGANIQATIRNLRYDQ